MNYSLEQIDVIKQRANVTYEEAREALDMSNGDIVAALVYLEKQNKIGKNSSFKNEKGGFVNTVKSLVKKGQETRFTISKNENTIINVPVNAVVATTIIASPITIGGVVVALFTKHKIKFVKPNGNDMQINKVIDKVSDKVSEKVSDITDEISKK